MNNRIDERYLNDSNFHRVVELIFRIIKESEGDLTPLDIRDACYLARLKYEQQVVRPIIFSDRFCGGER